MLLICSNFGLSELISYKPYVRVQKCVVIFFLKHLFTLTQLYVNVQFRMLLFKLYIF